MAVTLNLNLVEFVIAALVYILPYIRIWIYWLLKLLHFLDISVQFSFRRNLFGTFYYIFYGYLNHFFWNLKSSTSLPDIPYDDSRKHWSGWKVWKRSLSAMIRSRSILFRRCRPFCNCFDCSPTRSCVIQFNKMIFCSQLQIFKSLS